MRARIRPLPFATTDPEPWALPSASTVYRSPNPTTDSDDWRFWPRTDGEGRAL